MASYASVVRAVPSRLCWSPSTARPRPVCTHPNHLLPQRRWRTGQPWTGSSLPYRNPRKKPHLDPRLWTAVNEIYNGPKRDRTSTDPAAVAAREWSDFWAGRSEVEVFPLPVRRGGRRFAVAQRTLDIILDDLEGIANEVFSISRRLFLKYRWYIILLAYRKLLYLSRKIEIANSPAQLFTALSKPGNRDILAALLANPNELDSSNLDSDSDPDPASPSSPLSYNIYKIQDLLALQTLEETPQITRRKLAEITRTARITIAQAFWTIAQFQRLESLQRSLLGSRVGLLINEGEEILPEYVVEGSDELRYLLHFVCDFQEFPTEDSPWYRESLISMVQVTEFKGGEGEGERQTRPSQRTTRRNTV
ncbi:hypothetical protein ABW19_dt0208500 [Dactylella cylindrospora]|nr:hypothetical protein ABW19_dt0208500 [Dactylella cylindrospora]